MRDVSHTSTLTPRLRRLAAAFGLSLRGPSMTRGARGAGIVDRHSNDAVNELSLVRAGSVVFVTGASGAGKSTLLRRLGRTLAQRGVRVVQAIGDAPGAGEPGARGQRTCESIVDRLARVSGRGDEGALGALTGAGLAEATLWTRCEHELSVGERARFMLARAMASCARTQRGATRDTCLLVDEFASTLDTTTALSVASSLARWARSQSVACVLASAREDVVDGLAPDVLVYVRMGTRTSVLRAQEEPAHRTLRPRKLACRPRRFARNATTPGR